MDRSHRSGGQIQEPKAIAFLATIAWAEGTSKGGRDPYAVTYGYKYTITDFRDHPAVLGTWRGLALPDEYCRRAKQRLGCKSTAAGAYQITVTTWLDKPLRRLYLPRSFEPTEQDRFTWIGLVPSCGAQDLVLAGNIEEAILRCSRRWASFPGSRSGQPQRKLIGLLDVFEEQMGLLT